MKEKHAFWHGTISSEHFVQKAPHREAELLADFGNFTTEAVWLDEELQGITLYCGLGGITGISAHTSSGSSCIGLDSSSAKFFPVHGPDEVLSEIEVFTYSEFSPLAIIVSRLLHRHGQN